LEREEEAVPVPNGGIASMVLKVFTSIEGKHMGLVLQSYFYKEICGADVAHVTAPIFLC
jgi:hypothetical protein